MESFNQKQPIFDLKIDEEAKAQLLETARWTKFLAIIGYIILGLVILAGLAVGAGFFMAASMSELGEGFTMSMMVVYIAMAILYFFPTYYLYKYSILISPAIQSSNQEQFNLALSYQRRMFKFIGILMIIILVFYGLVILFALISAVVSGV